MSHDHETATSPTDIVPGQPRSQGAFIGGLAIGLLVFVALFTALVLISAGMNGFK